VGFSGVAMVIDSSIKTLIHYEGGTECEGSLFVFRCGTSLMLW
jgi:hypothetical protein